MASDEHSQTAPARWQFLRDVVVFQAKLALDGARDVALSPLSLAAALFGLVTRSDAPGHYFYRVVVAGRRSEDWIDLFEAADRIDPRAPGSARHAKVDDVFDRLATLLAEQQRMGSVTASAKEKIDRVLDSLPAAASRDDTAGTDPTRPDDAEPRSS